MWPGREIGRAGSLWRTNFRLAKLMAGGKTRQPNEGEENNEEQRFGWRQFFFLSLSSWCESRCLSHVQMARRSSTDNRPRTVHRSDRIRLNRRRSMDCVWATEKLKIDATVPRVASASAVAPARAMCASRSTKLMHATSSAH